MDERILRERAFFHWLYNIEGIGRKTIRKLMGAVGSAERVFGMEEEKLALLLSPAQRKKLLDARKQTRIRQGYEALRKKGIDLYPASDPMYPRRLLYIPDRPEAIYVKGTLPDENVPAVAVIGARVCSAYGAYAAQQFSSALASAGISTISGLARGIDGIGQRAVLEQDGRTCAVLGCGPDVCYPPENRELYEKIVRQGAVLSEYPPGTQPKAGLFPQRNRIISGLADLVLVIEAREKSGTLITVDMALEQGKEVWAVPGRVTDELSSGCNRLIWQGASPALSPSALLEELRKLSRKPVETNREISTLEAHTESESDGEREDVLRRAVLNLLDFSAKSPDRLYEELKQAGISCGLVQLMQLLVEMTLEGNCTQEGNRFRRKMS
ncbi:MAG TPA: DNA-processing protein DprA [Candidatus Eisenbergiella merdipullorum]|uniref:DNA-processing protein DprA n=1 Tax=Candidatus Eisenbergiella merdipullorum TaxID=2838553 RepID=A0A9D2L1X0_9FIRM|nr:DNA-processing protein DprA [Candidatus Eisenbergiella merdipullorum]